MKLVERSYDRDGGWEKEGLKKSVFCYLVWKYFEYL